METDTSRAPVAVAIALGSNLGAREDHLAFAVDRLSTLLDHLRVSSFHLTEPVGVPVPQPQFLNAAAVGHSRDNPRRLLERLLTIERERGRERPHERAARTLDLDLVLYGAIVIDEPGLQVPHPHFRERRFVLEPLAELEPSMRDPVTGLTVAQLLAKLNTCGAV